MQAMPIERILPSQVQAFSKALRAKLRDRSSTFAKDYLQAVVSEIRISGNTAAISGSYAQLMAAAAQKKKESNQVPSFMRDWRARQIRTHDPLVRRNAIVSRTRNNSAT